MSVALHGDVITLAGACGVEEAETLFSLVQGHPAAMVDLSGAGQVHTALWQILLVFKPKIIGEPDEPFARQWILPLLAGAT